MRFISFLCGVIAVFGFGEACLAVEVPESTLLKCIPPLDRSDSDPITDAWIYAKFDVENGFKVQTLTVVLHSRSGNAFERTDQYDAVLESDPSSFKWSWSGQLKRNRQYRMTGTLSYNGVWSYDEAATLNGRNVWSTEFSCPSP